MPAANHQRSPASVRRLARLHGIQTSYQSAFDRRVTASTDALIAALDAIGVDVGANSRGIAAATKDRVHELRARTAPHAATAWNGRATIDLRLGARPTGTIDAALTLESGETTEFSARAADLKTRKRKGPDDKPETITRLPIPGRLPHGYHNLSLTIAGHTHDVLVISAPTKSFRHDTDTCDHEWGLFCPIYALRSDRSLGCGDLTDLRHLAQWQSSLGAGVLATLPLLAVYLDEPFDPSPYAPVSRLFWNELFIDPLSTPEFEGCEVAQQRLRTSTFRREIESLDAAALIQYRRVAALRRSILEPLAERFFDSGADSSPEFKAFIEANPLARDYARFRAVMERQHRDWADWSTRLRGSNFQANDFNPGRERFHLYSQFRFQTQFADVAAEMKRNDSLVYLDLPVGVRRDGFDFFANQSLFSPTASVGAPPDPFFTSGQDWGFPPIIPDALQRQRYEYFIASLRNHMRFADFLRLDHVMGFYRLFIIPANMETADGVYLSYPDEDLCAILCLESHRNRCRLVGENLGTVPPKVNKALAKHDMAPLYVAQYAAQPRQPALSPVTPGSVASANTHDMPPLSTWWEARDVKDRIALHIFDPALEKRETRNRAKTRDALLSFLDQRHLASHDLDHVRDAIHEYLADSDADFVLLNIEDLWLEQHWQNIPGTLDVYPNWRHKLRFDLDEIRDDPDLKRQLKRIDTLRATHRHAHSDH